MIEAHIPHAGSDAVKVISNLRIALFDGPHDGAHDDPHNLHQEPMADIVSNMITKQGEESAAPSTLRKEQPTKAVKPNVWNSSFLLRYLEIGRVGN